MPLKLDRHSCGEKSDARFSRSCLVVGSPGFGEISQSALLLVTWIWELEMIHRYRRNRIHRIDSPILLHLHASFWSLVCSPL